MFLKLPKLKLSRKKWLVLAGATAVLLGGWFWYQKVCLNPYNVFWGTVDNNLSTTGLIRRTKQTFNNQFIDTYFRLHLGSQNAVETLQTVTQNNNPNYLVVQRTIGTPTGDYSSYKTIKTGQNGKDYSSIEGLWSKASTSQYFNRSILSTLPMANLNSSYRRRLIKTMQDNNVFSIDYKNAARQSGQYIYDVKINARAYFEMYRQYLNIIGVDSTNLPDPDSYAATPPLELKIYIKPGARQLSQIHYVRSNQDEFYSGYGLNQAIGIPSQTISQEDLQQRIQKTR